MGFSFKKLGKIAGGVFDQINPLDNGRTYKNPQGNNKKGTPAPSAWQQATGQAKHVGTGVGLGATRSITGTAQGVSGLYDLVTPGKGTNRTSKMLDTFAKLTDQTAKNEGVSNSIYKTAQAGTDIASLFAGAGFVKGGAAVTTKVAPRVVKPIAQIAPRIEARIAAKTAPLVTNGGADKLAAEVFRAGTKPANVAMNLATTGKFTGENASKGRDTSPKTVATDAAMGLGAEFGMPLVPALARAVPPAVRGAVNGVKKGVEKLDAGMDKTPVAAPKEKPVVTPKVEKTQDVKDIQRIHILKKEAGIDDKTYHQIIKNTTGKKNANHLTPTERKQVMEAIKPGSTKSSGKHSGAEISQKRIDASNAQKKAGRAGYVSRKWSAFKNNLIDPLAMDQKSDRLTAKKEGVKYKDFDASRQTTKLRNDAQNSDAILIDKVKKTDLDGKGTTLQKVIQKYAKQSEQFMSYVAAKSDLENRGFKNGKKIDPSKTKAQLKAIIYDFERRNKGADADAQSIKKFKDVIDQEAIATGMGDKLVTNRKYYFPTKAAESEGKVKPKTNNLVDGGNSTTTIESRRGTTQNIDYSYEAMLHGMGNSQKKVLENRLFNEYYRRATMGTVEAKRVPVSKVADVNKIDGFVNNKHVAVEFSENMSKAVAKLTDTERDKFTNWLWQLPAGAAKLVYTGVLNPVFHTTQLVKNPLVMLHNGGVRTLDPRTLVDAAKGAVNQGKFSEKNLTKYGANQIKGITQTASKQKVRAEILALNKKSPADLAKFVINDPKQSWEEAMTSIDRMYAVSDRVFRSQMAAVEYHRVVGKVGEEKAMEAAARMYNEGMGNFNRVTKAARAAEPILLYSGAIQTGARSFARAYKDRPLETALIDGALVGSVGYLIQETLGDKKGKEFYADMNKSGKSYVLDDNIIIVTPTASRDDKGNWTGVIKIPLAPDYRPLNRAVRKFSMGQGFHLEDVAGHVTGDIIKGTSQIPTTNPTITTASVAMNRDPRYGGNIVSEFESNTKKSKDQYDKYTSGFAKSAGEKLGWSPKKIDKFLDNAGLAGDMLQNRDGRNPISIIKDSLSRQFGKGLKGDSPGAKYYKDLDVASSQLKDEDDWTFFKGLHTNNSHKSVEDSAQRSQILLNNPNVMNAEIAMSKLAKKRGEKVDPFYDLPAEQQNKILRYRASKDLRSASQDRDKYGNTLYEALGLDEKWYSEFQDKETAFYKSLPGGGDDNSPVSTFSGVAKPELTAKQKALEEQYYELPSGTGQRSAFLKENPWMLENWAAKNSWTNAERAAMGMKMLGDSGSTTGSGSSYSGSGSSGYNSRSGSSKGSRGSGGSSYEPFANSTKYMVDIPKELGKPKVTRTSVAKPTISLKKRGSKKAKVTMKKLKT